MCQGDLIIVSTKKATIIIKLKKKLSSADSMERGSHSGSAMNRHTGFLCHFLFANGSAQYVLLDANNHGFPTINRSASFSTETNLHICASCDGLLLLSSFVGNCLHYTLWNLFTKLSIPLPEPLVTTRDIGTGFSFDGQHYQVVRIFSIEVPIITDLAESTSRDRKEYSLEMEIFSSKTGLWIQHHPSIRLPPDLPKLSTLPLYSNGSIYWELGGFLLVYNASNGFCRFIELPNNSPDWSWFSMTFGQCLWESEGHVHYCYTNYEGINTWVLLKEQDQWKLVHKIKHQTLVLSNPMMVRQIELNSPGFPVLPWKPHFVSPCGYSEDSQTMYLRLPGMFVSYNVRTRVLKEICSFTFPDQNFYSCLFVPYAQGDPTISGDVSPMLSSRLVGNGDLVSLPVSGLQVRRKSGSRVL